MEKLNTNNAPAAIGPYSQAVKTGNLLFTSGQIALDPATGEIVGTTIEEQTEQVMKNLGAILKEAGATYENAVKTVCFLDNMDDFATVNGIYAEYFVEPYPARSAVEVAKLPKGALIEVEVIAKK